MSKVNDIICGNHLDVLKEYPDGCIDMVLTSPPYDNLRDYKGYTFEFEPLAHELFRVLKDGGVCVWIVNDATVNGSETLTSFRQALYFNDVVGFNVHDTMIYSKNYLTFPDKSRYQSSFEYMFVLSKGKILVTNLIADKGNRNFNQKIAGSQRTKEGGLVSKKKGFIKKMGIRTNIWAYHSASMEEGSEHPARFPERLAEDHILSWSNPGDIVLDPMCGSGTTCKMAVKHGRQYVGIDIAEEYCELSRQRLEKFTTQTSIFDVVGYNNALHRTQADLRG